MTGIIQSIEIIFSILTSCIAIYLFALRYIPYFRKVSFYSTEFHYDIFKGRKISVVIENKSLSSISIKNVNLIFENKYILKICEHDEPYILKPFESKKFSSDYITSIDTKYEKFDDFAEVDLLLEVYANNPKNKYIWGQSKRKFKGIDYYEQISVHRKSFNGVIYGDSVKYILNYISNSKEKDIFILENGWMSEDIAGINSIKLNESNKIQSAEELVKYFESIFKKDIKFAIVNLINHKTYFSSNHK